MCIRDRTVSIQAEAGSATQVTKVWFTLNGVGVSTDTTAPYAYSWPITGMNNGAHTWTATAFDAMANSSSTVGVPVTVNIDVLSPSTPVLICLLYTSKHQVSTLCFYRAGSGDVVRGAEQ